MGHQAKVQEEAMAPPPVESSSRTDEIDWFYENEFDSDEFDIYEYEDP